MGAHALQLIGCVEYDELKVRKTRNLSKLRRNRRAAVRRWEFHAALDEQGRWCWTWQETEDGVVLQRSSKPSENLSGCMQDAEKYGYGGRTGSPAQPDAS
jgi:hypothetical protein